MNTYNDKVRLILYHKQATSARMRFLQLDYGGVCAFEPLPALSSVIDGEDATVEEGNIVIHPAPLVTDCERRLGLDPGDLVADSDFQASVDTPDGVLQVYLARFTATDPPFEVAGQAGARFIAITEARKLPPAELELLRRAYAAVMEG